MMNASKRATLDLGHLKRSEHKDFESFTTR